MERNLDDEPQFGAAARAIRGALQFRPEHVRREVEAGRWTSDTVASWLMRWARETPEAVAVAPSGHLPLTFAAALERARERDVWLPVRPVTRRRWPNGRVTHEELRPLKVLASRMPCPYFNPGQYVRGRPLVQGMRVALAAEVARTHEELVERILHAGLAYSDAVDRETSLVICNDATAEQGKGYLARKMGVPVVSDALFMDCIRGVVRGTSMEEFAAAAARDEQLALF